MTATAIIIVVGIVLMLMQNGMGVIGDFGSAEGVIRLLANPDIALVAWIHILAFDQVVAMVIYRDNMEHRYVPLPVQSVLLFATLMFGPVGFLGYYLLRAWSRGRRDRAGAGEGRAARGRGAAAPARDPRRRTGCPDHHAGRGRCRGTAR